MNSRSAVSALYILIAAMVIAAHGAGLREKLRALQVSCADKISAARALPILEHSRPTGSQPPRAVTAAAEGGTIPVKFPDATRCLGSQARHLQHFVLDLIGSDHQGE